MLEINIDKIKVFANHGVFEEEKKNGQFFYISLNLKLKDIEFNDELSSALDYSAVTDKVYIFTKEHTFNLIETLADRLTKMLLNEFDLIEEVSVLVHKPHAPVKEKIDDISVSVTRKWVKTYVALGSNLGERENYITEAIKKIESNEAFKNIKKSSLIETKPYGVTNQGKFINGAMSFETYLTKTELLKYLKGLEKEADRTKTIRWGERTLDLDILFFGREIFEDDNLTIPHPDMKNRDFVLIPLNELNENLLHPVYNISVKEMLENLKNK